MVFLSQEFFLVVLLLLLLLLLLWLIAGGQGMCCTHDFLTEFPSLSLLLNLL